MSGFKVLPFSCFSLLLVFRIAEQPGWEGTTKRSSGPALRGRGGLGEVIWHPAQLHLETSSEGDSAIFLGRLLR